MLLCRDYFRLAVQILDLIKQSYKMNKIKTRLTIYINLDLFPQQNRCDWVSKTNIKEDFLNFDWDLELHW